MATKTITIPHLGRVEGHGGIRVSLAEDAVTDVNMDIHEGSRYYEKLLVGKHFRDVQGIITRVCAICSADHTVAALEALESALDVCVSARTRELRGLLLRGAAIESHALHIFALALPDFLGYGSVMAMAERFPDEVAFALRLKQLGNHVQTLIGGRAVHPINTLVGGFGRIPPQREVESLRRDLEAVLDPLMVAVEMVSSIDVPDWAARKTLFVALRPGGPGFGFRGDVICTSDEAEYPVADYRETVREFTVEHSRASHASLESGETYMVGSLARLDLWADRLVGRAAQAYHGLFPNGATDNVLLNTRAQMVETVFCVESAIEICGTLLARDEIRSELRPVEERAGRGVGAVEAPRGTLFHEYELDDDGRVVAANVITPTAQNLANVEKDLRCSGDRLLGAAGISDNELQCSFEMIARAYDPCISCSVHVLRESPEDHLPARQLQPDWHSPGPSRLLIVGLGNPMMADDGLGHAVADLLLQKELPAGVCVEVIDGDVLGIAESWRGEPAVWLVDAVSGLASTGTLQVLEHEELLSLPGDGLSAHHPSVSESLRWLIHTIPPLAEVRFRLFGVEVESVAPGEGLSRTVDEAAVRLAEMTREAALEWIADQDGQTVAPSDADGPLSSF